MHTKNIRRTSGFTLVEIMIVVAIIGLLAAIAIPNFIKARQSSQRVACTANLRTIYGAKQTWATEAHKQGTDVPTEADLFGPTLYIKDKPTCPANGTYTLNAVDQNPTCSIADHTL